jgi:hypothetical protein
MRKNNELKKYIFWNLAEIKLFSGLQATANFRIKIKW